MKLHRNKIYLNSSNKLGHCTTSRGQSDTSYFKLNLTSRFFYIFPRQPWAGWQTLPQLAGSILSLLPPSCMHTRRSLLGDSGYYYMSCEAPYTRFSIMTLLVADPPRWNSTTRQNTTIWKVSPWWLWILCYGLLDTWWLWILCYGLLGAIHKSWSRHLW